MSDPMPPMPPTLEYGRADDFALHRLVRGVAWLLLVGGAAGSVGHAVSGVWALSYWQGVNLDALKWLILAATPHARSPTLCTPPAACFAF